MGRIGDGDVHAAYVEFRAKESDKVRPPFHASAITTVLPHHDAPYTKIHQQTRSMITKCNPTTCMRRSFRSIKHTTDHATTTSASQHNASTANPSAQKTPPANASTSSNAPTTSPP